MAGPAPTYRPTLTLEQVRDCERLVPQQNAPQVQVARAKLALLLHTRRDLDSVTAARQHGEHPNGAYTWRKRWATEGFRLTDKPGRGRKPAFSPGAGGDGHRPRLRVAGATRSAAQPV